MNNTHRVAVLLAAYNGSKYISQQIVSICNQKDVSVKIFISIDYCTDDTYQIAKHMSKYDSRIIILPYGKRFGSAAKNFFRLISEVDFTHFDYVSFSDQDDIWFHDKLFRAITIIKKQKYDAYSSNIIAFWENGRYKKINKAQKQKKYDHLFEAAGPGCTYVLRKELIETVQSAINDRIITCENVILHDWFLYTYIRIKEFRWYIDKHSTMLYRQHPYNEVGANIGFNAFLYRTKKILQGEGFLQIQEVLKIAYEGKNHFLNGLKNNDRSVFLSVIPRVFECRRKRTDSVILLISCILLYFLSGVRFRFNKNPLLITHK